MGSAVSSPYANPTTDSPSGITPPYLGGAPEAPAGLSAPNMGEPNAPASPL
jgi:hypothetical protein